MRHSPPDWSRFDVLIRELGALRASSHNADEVDAEVTAEVDRHIQVAAQAVDALVDAPNDNERAVTAWEQILRTQDLIGRIRESTARSGDLTMTAIELRQRAAAALRASDRLRKKLEGG